MPYISPRRNSGTVLDVQERSDIGGYQLVQKIGFGGMSTVYEALDGGGERVALKLLHPSIAADPNARDRLRREVRTLRQVTGPYVAQVLDAETEDEEAFIVTELIDGPTLSVDVSENGVFVGKDLADLATELAEALQAIHSKGVLHRDLKPSNVMMSQRGPVLIDFGIAQIAEESRLTMTGMLAHTPGYAAPEVLNGDDPTTGADWWSWAATLAYAATGHAPFGTGQSPKVTRKVHTGESDLTGADPVVAYALEAALNPRPDRRPNPSEVIGMLNGTIAVSEEDLALGPAYTSTIPREPTPPTQAQMLNGNSTEHVSGEFMQPPPFYAPQARHAVQYPPGDQRPMGFPVSQPVEQQGPPQQEGPRDQQATGQQPSIPPQQVQQASPYDHTGSAVFHPRQDSAVVAHARLDPRFSRNPAPVPDWLKPAPKRPLLTVMIWLVYTVWAGVLPVVMIGVFIVYMVITSVIGVSRQSLIQSRIERGGRYRTESFTILSRLPISIFGGAARTLASVGSGVVLGGALAWFGYQAMSLDEIVCVAVGALIGTWVAWAYPTSGPSRESTRYLLSSIAPSSGYRMFWVVLGVALLSLAIPIYLNGPGPDWVPLSRPFIFN